MLFSSVGFLFRFLPIFMILYLIVPAKYRNAVLLLGSLIFYGVGEPYFVLLLILSILINYAMNCLLFLHKNRAVLSATIILDFGLLFLFKYWDFTATTLQKITGKPLMPMLYLALPLGISFYTFQMVSYQIDCYRGDIEKPVGLLEFGTYVSLFPQLIAGPIVKYKEVAERLQKRKLTGRGIENGLKLFTIGLGFKVLLANQIGTLWNTIMTAGAGSLAVPVAWLGAFAYSFQIYFDFWGYSLMAVGLGKMLGFVLPRNFNNPYVAKSVTEFWRRWHITLGRWFREYVYIPLGGNRKGKARTILNLFLVWAFTGLWHGAAWNFVIWGILFFFLQILEKNGLGAKLEKSKVVGHLYMIILIPVTWVIFAITDGQQLLAYLGNMIGIHSGKILVGMTQFGRYLKEYWWLLLLCVMFSTSYPQKIYNEKKDTWYMIGFLLAVFWLSVHEIIVGSNNPFLYFRF